MTTSLIPGNTGAGPCFPRPFRALKCYSAVTSQGCGVSPLGAGGNQSSEEINVSRWRARVQQIYSNFWS